MSAIVEVACAEKRFTAQDGGVINALDGLSFEIEHKQFVTLLGPSGCGKTTLLKTISGLEELDAGDVQIAGESMIGVPSYRRPVNTVFQNYALFPHLSVADNVGYGLDVAGIAKAERNQRVQEALERVGLAGFDRRKPRQLSGGQQQRVALARAVINRPKLLLLDEPLSALDRNLRQSMQIELKNLQHDLDICFLFVTHDQEEALTMSDQIVVLKDGRIEQIGSPEEHYHRPASSFVAQFIGDGALFSGKIQYTQNGPTLVTDDGLSFAVSDSTVEGETVTLLLRPEHLDIANGTADNSTGVINVTLEQIVFYGSMSKLICRLANGEPIIATPSTATGFNPGRVNPGDSLNLTYQRDTPHLIRDYTYAA